ncbi:hypothetical protein D3C71_1410160 [compost metagenome]
MHLRPCRSWEERTDHLDAAGAGRGGRMVRPRSQAVHRLVRGAGRRSRPAQPRGGHREALRAQAAVFGQVHLQRPAPEPAGGRVRAGGAHRQARRGRRRDHRHAGLRDGGRGRELLARHGAGGGRCQGPAARHRRAGAPCSSHGQGRLARPARALVAERGAGCLHRGQAARELPLLEARQVA